jgi:anti-sigma B factor antagonist
MPPPILEVAKYRVGSVVVLKPSGDVRVRNMLVLRKEFEELADRPKVRVAVDLSDVTFLDSSAIGLFTNVANRLGAGGGMLFLFGCNKDLGDLLEMTNIGEIVPVLRDLEELEGIEARGAPRAG